MKVRTLLTLALTATPACMVPHSASFGQTGEMLAPGAFETAVTPGLAWRSETTHMSAAVATPVGQPQAVISYSGTSAGFSLSQLEGNVAYGMSEAAAVNLHLSPAGLQPGVKLRLLNGPLRVALMPEVAFSRVNFASSGTTTSDGVERSSSGSEPLSVTSMQAGFKVLGRHESGFYGGLGYTFQTASFSPGNGLYWGSSSSAQYSYSAHQIQAAAGFELVTGAVRVRPELAAIYSPALTYWLWFGPSPIIPYRGSELLLFANVSLAIASPSGAAPAPRVANLASP